MQITPWGTTLYSFSVRRSTAIYACRKKFPLLLTGMILTIFSGCSKPPAEAVHPPVEVTEITIMPRDIPVELEFVAQTQSSRQVEIRARVEGFLEKRLYTEGELVQAGQKMYQMDPKPFEAALQSARGQLAEQEAQLAMNQATLDRVQPLAEKNALSKKNLDDAIGAVRQAQAAVFAAQGVVQTAKLNLSYTTLYSPLTGLSSFSKKHEGSYLSPGTGGLLTYVAQLDPIWVNFSISENQMLKYRSEIERGRLKFPPRNLFDVEVTLADGYVYPYLGHIDFSEPTFSQETGTFLVRTEFANPKGDLRPGQFVRVHLKGAIRPHSILVPQRAVLQGAKSYYVWVIDKDGKAARREVEIGDWQGDGWFINHGLLVGESVVVDGAIRLSPGAALKVVDTSVSVDAASGTAPGVRVENTPAEIPRAPGSPIRMPDASFTEQANRQPGQHPGKKLSAEENLQPGEKLPE
ncbi:efflux RND transporter periplasmic adaptor subunit [Nitrosospira briensis]|uniref:efflux RND transporter periplasmic adaptor subunit n=1 Tax=Nitrosospira briensis TaxID=35799 RepID=UPI0009E27A49|nr:efflux RND transporter periplasmic adaptor subunit [Nitrosospira briensis]